MYAQVQVKVRVPSRYSATGFPGFTCHLVTGTRSSAAQSRIAERSRFPVRGRGDGVQAPGVRLGRIGSDEAGRPLGLPDAGVLGRLIVGFSIGFTSGAPAEHELAQTTATTPATAATARLNLISRMKSIPLT
ncbi:hypothetical protein GCM10009804_30990 [Kribbella hippodromi]|uniref:Uncharacterized protein n=1 Tax=Kribbella hippodromi TaxID=434347 RepID=A0ABN2DB70_9ACTN